MSGPSPPSYNYHPIDEKHAPDSPNDDSVNREGQTPRPVDHECGNVEEEQRERCTAGRRRRRRAFHFVFALLALVFLGKHLASSSVRSNVVGWCRKKTSGLIGASHGPESFLWDDAQTVCTSGVDGWHSIERWTVGDGANSNEIVSYKADREFQFSANSALHLFESTIRNRSPVNGHLIFKPAKEGADPETITVKVNAEYKNADALAAFGLCKVQAGDKDGLAMTWAGTESFGDDDSIIVDVEVHVPAGQYIPEIIAKTPNFNVEFAPGIEFGDISIEADNGHVLSHGLNSNGKVSVNTANTPITGHFNVSAPLSLVTSNAPIDVQIDAYHYLHHWPTTIKIITSNAGLNATLSLYNGTASPAYFHAKARTANGPLNLALLQSPTNGIALVDGRTSNAPAELALDAAFEGTFAAGTSNAEPTLKRREGVKDPSGAGRERIVEVSAVTPRAVAGTAAWGEPLGKKHKHSSVASVKTSNKPVTIVL